MKVFKILFWFFIFNGLSSVSFSQAYQPLLEDSTTWDTWILPSGIPVCGESAYRTFVKGDTLINGTLYKKICGYPSVNLTPLPCPIWAFDNTALLELAYLREDTAQRKVYRLEPGSPEYVLFDFSLLPGDTILFPLGMGVPFEVDSINYFQLFDSSMVKVIWLSYQGMAGTIEYMMERIGGSAGMYSMLPSAWLWGSSWPGCVFSNGEQLWDGNFIPTIFSTCPGLTGNTNQIHGNAFLDLNSNLVYDSGDVPLQQHRVEVPGTYMFDFTDTLGNYQAYVADSGNFLIKGDLLGNFNSIPLINSAYFSSFLQVDTLNDFAYQPTSIFEDLEVLIYAQGGFRTGQNGSYWIRAKNIGTTTLSPTVILKSDPLLTYISSSENPSLINNDTVKWNLPPLTPFQKHDISVTFLIDTGLAIGTPVNSFVDIYPMVTDTDTSNNSSTWPVLIVGSCDPNDIQVDRDTLYSNEFPGPPHLNYRIRFQNTGNDTAFYVRIENTLPIFLDPSSLEFVSSSHQPNLTWNHLLNQLVVEFDNILLPDSNVNEPASHGYLSYRIRPHDFITAGTYINNRASIIFDLNQPVVTNYATTVVVLPLAVIEISDYNLAVVAYPNPVTDNLKIKCKSGNCNITKINLFSSSGKLIYSRSIKNEGDEINIDTHLLSKGMYILHIETGNKFITRKIVRM